MLYNGNADKQKLEIFLRTKEVKWWQYSSIVGISGEVADIRSREEFYERNLISTKKSQSFLKLVWSALQQPTLLILEGTAVISFVVALWSIFAGPTFAVSTPKPSLKR